MISKICNGICFALCVLLNKYEINFCHPFGSYCGVKQLNISAKEKKQVTKGLLKKYTRDTKYNNNGNLN